MGVVKVPPDITGMSSTPSGNIGIPVKLLHESEGHTITVELKTGEVYRGHLVESEDNMNMQLSNVTLTARDGRISNIEQCFIRGSKIRFMARPHGCRFTFPLPSPPDSPPSLQVLPAMLKNAPMFKRIDPKLKGQGGRGAAMGGPPMGGGASRFCILHRYWQLSVWCGAHYCLCARRPMIAGLEFTT